MGNRSPTSAPVEKHWSTPGLWCSKVRAKHLSHRPGRKALKWSKVRGCNSLHCHCRFWTQNTPIVGEQCTGYRETDIRLSGRKRRRPLSKNFYNNFLACANYTSYDTNICTDNSLS